MIGWRRQYGDILRDRVRVADVRGLFDLGIRWLGTALSRGRPLVGPALGTLVVTYRCDLRCRVCQLPQRAAARRRAGEHELDTPALAGVLTDMRAIGTAGVGVTGGEPMLRSDTEALLAHGSRIGMHMHLNSDGFRVADAARDLVRTGMRSANISLDAATAQAHDRARGRAGAFDTALEALGALRRARGTHRAPRVTAVTVLTASNIAEVESVADVAREAGADRLGIIPVHDFGQGERTPDPTAVASGVDALHRLHAAGFLDNSLAYVDLVPRALAGQSSPLRCYAPQSSVVVDCYGDVYPCFPLMERAEPVGRIPLIRMWRSRAYEEARRRLASCRACLWNCHTELNLALPQTGRLAGRAG